MRKIDIGLIGKNGSGKSTICEYLKTKGAWVVSLSDFVREAAWELGRPIDRNALIQTANELKATQGLDYLAKRAFQASQAQSQLASLLVYDSIRHPAEVAYLQQKGVILFGIQTPITQRFERVKSRSGDTDQISWETFEEQDHRESTGQSSGQSINECLDHCDAILLNDGSIDDLYRKVDILIQSLHKKR